MGWFVSYMLQVSVIMTLLYLGYKWLMAGTTFHAFNRLTLISILMGSWLIPLILIPVMQPRCSADIELGAYQESWVPMMPEPLAATNAAFVVAQIVLLIYAIGVLTVMSLTAWGVLRMFRLIRGGEYHREDGYKLVINPKAPGPMSWGNYIILRPQDCDADMAMVLRHERAHLQSRHWLDLLLTQLNLIFQWYNPSAWLLMREVKCVHEYQADAKVACDDAATYQLMLLKKTVGSSFPTFTDSLNHSQIKKRITMMLRKKSVSARRLAVLVLPAMAALGVFTLTIPAVAGRLSELQHASMPDFSQRKISDFGASVQAVSEQEYSAAAVSTVSHDVSEVPYASQPADDEREVDELQQTVQTEPASTEPPAYFVNGKLFTGNLNDIRPSDIKSMTVVKNDPDYPQGKIMIELNKPGDNVTTAPEKIAEFKGGVSGLMDFISQNIKMPDVALQDKERVIVQFTIGTDGSVSNPVVIRGAKFAELDKEAVRVVRATDGMWIPAETSGKPVATRFVLPVLFSPTPSK